MSETRNKLEEAANRILALSRTQLYLAMHFLGPSLDSLSWQMDLSTASVGTDAYSVRYNPAYLTRLYRSDKKQVNRTYLHMLFHCLFLHMFYAKSCADRETWDLSCDIAAEALLDSLDSPAVKRLSTDYREEWYRRLDEEIGVLTAQKIYRYFSVTRLPVDEFLHLQQEFRADDHSFWERMQDSERPDPPIPETPAPKRNARDDWKDRSERMKNELESGSDEDRYEIEALRRQLQIQTRRRVKYRDFLSRYAVIREEVHIDPDSFDYGFYNYGMELYGNMPLIEENEYREARRVDELVIAIDTSASCQETLVEQFLSETAAVLESRETFFHHISVRILQCDEQVHKDIPIGDPGDIRNFLEKFDVDGGAGTDFRPVFDYVAHLREQGELKNLRGLLYFTDGYGVYPTEPTDYETVFVFWKEDYNDIRVPDWAVKLYLDDDFIEEE